MKFIHSTLLLALAAGIPLSACSSSTDSAISTPSLPTFAAYFTSVSNGEYSIHLADATGAYWREVTSSVEHPGLGPNNAILSPDGSLFAISLAGTDGLRILDNQFSLERTLFPDPSTSALSPSRVQWAPRGSHFLVQFSDGSAGFTQTYTSSGDSDTLTRIALDSDIAHFQGWSEDGSMLALDAFSMGLTTRELQVFSVTGVPLTDLANGSDYEGLDLTWSANHMSYPVASTLGTAPQVRFNQFTELNGISQLVSPISLSMDQMLYNYDGSWLAGVGESIVVPTATQVQLALIPQSNLGAPILIEQHDLDVFSSRLLGWSPTNLPRVAMAYSGINPLIPLVSGERLILVRIDGQQQRILPEAPAGSTIGHLAWSPNGRYLAFTSDHELVGLQRLYMVDLALNLTPVQQAPDGLVAHANTLQWTSDSRWLYSTHRVPTELGHCVAASDMLDFGSCTILADRVASLPTGAPAMEGTPGLPGMVVVQVDENTFSQNVTYVNAADPGNLIRISDPNQTGSAEVQRLWVRGPSSGL